MSKNILFEKVYKESKKLRERHTQFHPTNLYADYDSIKDELREYESQLDDYEYPDDEELDFVAFTAGTNVKLEDGTTGKEKVATYSYSPDGLLELFDKHDNLLASGVISEDDFSSFCDGLSSQIKEK